MPQRKLSDKNGRTKKHNLPRIPNDKREQKCKVSFRLGARRLSFRITHLVSWYGSRLSMRASQSVPEKFAKSVRLPRREVPFVSRALVSTRVRVPAGETGFAGPLIYTSRMLRKLRQRNCTRLNTDENIMTLVTKSRGHARVTESALVSFSRTLENTRKSGVRYNVALPEASGYREKLGKQL